MHHRVLKEPAPGPWCARSQGGALQWAAGAGPAEAGRVLWGGEDKAAPSPDGFSPFSPLPCCEDLGDPVTSRGHDFFISESGCSYLLTLWGGKVSGGVRRAHSQPLARKGAVGGTAPPCGGSPCPRRPGVQGTTCSPSRPFPAQRRRVSDPSRRCLWKVVYETHSSSDNTGDTRMSSAEPGVLANLGHRRE